MSRPSNGTTRSQPSRPAPQWKPVTRPVAPAATRQRTAKPRSAPASKRPVSAPRGTRPGRPKPSKVAIGLAIGLGLAAILGLGWMTMWFTARGEIVQGTTVAGIDIGGVVPLEAERILTPAVDELLNEPVVLMIDGHHVEVTPAEAGIGVDIPATLARTDVTEGLDPVGLWHHFTGGADVDPVVTVQERAFSRAMNAIDKQVGSSAKNASVVITAKGARVTPPSTGLAIDRDLVRSILLDQWAGDQRSGMLSLSDAEPAIGDAEVAEFMDQFVDQALSGPVTLKFGAKTLTLPASQFGPSIKVRSINGVLEGQLNNKEFAELVRPTIRAARTSPVNARVALVNGAATVVPGRAGRVYSVSAATDSFLSVLMNKNKRTAQVAAKVTKPGWTTEDARGLNIRTVIGSASTRGEWTRKPSTVSIGSMNGVVVKPGGSFTLSNFVGSITPEVAQSFKQAAREAGLDVTRRSFVNRSTNGVLVQAWVETKERTKTVYPGDDADHDDWDDRGERDRPRTRTFYRTTVTVQIWGS